MEINKRINMVIPEITREKRKINISEIPHASYEATHVRLKRTREGERILLHDLDGKLLTPAKIASCMVKQAEQWHFCSKRGEFSDCSAIAGGLQDTIKAMDPDTKQAVFAEIEKQSGNGLLNSLKSQVEKEEQQKQSSDDGIIM